MSAMGAVCRVVLGQRCCACGTCTSEGSADRLWLASESIGTLLTAGQSTALVLELGHGDGREGRSSVVLSLVLVNLVDRNGGVDDRWLDGLLLDDGLDGLVDVVVDVLASNGWGGSRCVLSLANGALILELGSLGCETLLYMVVVSVLDVALLSSSHVVAVLLWEDLAVLDGLHGGVIVVLVDLAIHGSLDLLLLGTSDVLVLNGGVHGLPRSQYTDMG